MEMKDIQRKGGELKKIRVNLLTTKSSSKWMKENNVSPQALFDKALEEMKKKK